MQAKDVSGIPHADQAANVKDPRLPGCDAQCQCTHGKDEISGWAGGPVCSCKNEKQTTQGKGSNLQPRTTAAVTAAVPATDSLHQNFNTAYRGSNRLSVAGQSKAAHMQAKDVSGIPHADQAANPYTSECEDHRRRHANLGRKSRQTKRFGSPFQAAYRRLTLSVTSLCV